jgi:hypothetical protein
MIKDEQLNDLSAKLMDLVVEWAHENNLEPTVENTTQVGAVFLLNSVDLLSASKFGDGKQLTKEDIEELKSIMVEAVDVYYTKESAVPTNVVLH